MTATQRFLAEIKDRYSIGSDYKLIKLTGFSQPKVSAYQNGRRQLDDLECFRVAELLELDPAQVIAEVNAERETMPARREKWREIAHRYTGHAAAVLLGISLFTPSPSAFAAVGQAALHCILC